MRLVRGVDHRRGASWPNRQRRQRRQHRQQRPTTSEPGHVAPIKREDIHLIRANHKKRGLRSGLNRPLKNVSHETRHCHAPLLDGPLSRDFWWPALVQALPDLFHARRQGKHGLGLLILHGLPRVLAPLQRVEAHHHPRPSTYPRPVRYPVPVREEFIESPPPSACTQLVGCRCTGDPGQRPRYRRPILGIHDSAPLPSVRPVAGAGAGVQPLLP